MRSDTTALVCISWPSSPPGLTPVLAQRQVGLPVALANRRHTPRPRGIELRPQGHLHRRCLPASGDSSTTIGLECATARRVGEALLFGAMFLIATQAGLLAAELEARGFLAGIGKFILVVIVIVVALGALIGFSVARRFGGRR